MTNPAEKPARPRRRLAAAGLALVALSAGCTAPEWLYSPPSAAPPPRPVTAAPMVTSFAPSSNGTTLVSGQPTHGQVSRDRGERLDAVIDMLLLETGPAVNAVTGQLAQRVGGLHAPLKLATDERGLKGWGAAERRSFQAEVDAAYDTARGQLSQLQGLAMATATQIALDMATSQPFLENGLTGDRQLDLRLTALDEVLDSAVNIDSLESAREQDKARGLELLESFSSFGIEGAEEALDGRLMLFIGGDEFEGAPRCMLVYRHDGPRDAGSYSFAQVYRHRIMRGDALVQEIPWRPVRSAEADGFPARFLYDEYLVAQDVQPVINTAAPNFHELHDMRIVADVQSAMISPEGEIIGGVDWRIQFAVSRRGDLTWNVAGGEPRWDAWCTEARRVLTGAP